MEFVNIDLSVFVPRTVGKIGEVEARGICSLWEYEGQATPTPATIKPLVMPDQFL